MQGVEAAASGVEAEAQDVEAGECLSQPAVCRITKRVWQFLSATQTRARSEVHPGSAWGPALGGPQGASLYGTGARVPPRARIPTGTKGGSVSDTLEHGECGHGGLQGAAGQMKSGAPPISL